MLTNRREKRMTHAVVTVTARWPESDAQFKKIIELHQFACLAFALHNPLHVCICEPPLLLLTVLLI